ncbi:unnamed protein product [Enterobius vermicularis]|uniref:Glutathione peroxidase n=1 Tax=Enterobius vermicularis TaxID=51028 RepID=A0A3P6HWD3_ENTVE|nr:unnamed protein product [Enterobius vermicularis]
MITSKVILGPEIVDESSRYSTCKETTQTIYDFRVQTLNNDYVDLSRYRGKLLLIVNVATFCGTICPYTQQYLDFNPMLERNNKSDLYIAAFPCNQFYLQEPALNHEIMNGVMYVRPGNGWRPHKKLHIYGKVEVNGNKQHPLFEFLKNQCPQTVDTIGKRDELMYDVIRPNDITWNFEKFLVDRNGVVRYRFHPTAWEKGETVQRHVDHLASKLP